MNKKQFIKKISKNGLLVKEAKKLDEIRKISKKTDLFRVPKILEINKQKRYLVLEKIVNSVELRKHLIINNNIFFSDIKKLKRLYFKLGKIIGYIHNNLKLSVKEKITIKGFNKRENCFLHGDLGLSNILIKKDSIWIIDPSINNFQDKIYLFGPYYYDLAHIIVYTDIMIPLLYFPFYKKKNTPNFEKAILLGYEGERKIKINIKKLKKMKKILLINYYNARRNKSGILYSIRRKIIENGLKNY